MRDSHKRLKDVCLELTGEVKGGWLTAVDATQVTRLLLSLFLQNVTLSALSCSQFI